MSVTVHNHGPSPIKIAKSNGESADLGVGANTTVDLGDGFSVLPYHAAEGEPAVSPQTSPPDAPTDLQPGGSPFESVDVKDSTDASVTSGGQPSADTDFSDTTPAVADRTGGDQ